MSSTDASYIQELVRVTGAETAEDAIRLKARQLLELYQSIFGDLPIPVDISALVGLAGIKQSDEAPILSPDAEIGPDGTGGVEMRVHPDRPETRKRFSIAHEISHTFFPEYHVKEWCRTDARYRDRSDPSQYIEMLCDIGAAELLFPSVNLRKDIAMVTNASGLAALASKYVASREATIRKFVEESEDAIAATFFSWKLKPKQRGTVGKAEQGNLFGITPDEEIREAVRLRIDYAIYSESFRKLGYFFPAEKSINKENPIYRASSSACCTDGESHLEIGQASGDYRIMAVPLPTEKSSRGPNGEYSVAAVLKPLFDRKQKVKSTSPDRQGKLFD